MTECIHQPEPKPGNKCNCFECRTARMRVFSLIMQHCVRCAGRCATDANGQLTCEKRNYACPLLDMWYAVINRDTDPADFDAVKVELILQGRREPPKRYRRTPPRPGGGFKTIPDFDREPAPVKQKASSDQPVPSAAENVPARPRRKRSG
jgi:hypothetical protein